MKFLNIVWICFLVLAFAFLCYRQGHDDAAKQLKPTINSFWISDTYNKMNVTIGGEEYDFELGVGEPNSQYRALKITTGKTNWIFDLVYGTNTFDTVKVYKWNKL